MNRADGQNLRTASSADVKTPAALCELARQHLQAGRDIEAQLRCQQALAVDAHFAEALYLMGLLSLRAEQADHACEWFTRAIRVNPRPVYLMSLGTTLRRQGRLEEACKAIEQAVRLDADSIDGWKALGQCLAELKRHHEAAVASREVLARDPHDADAAYQAGLLFFQAGRLEEALALLDTSNQLRANHAPTLQMRALALQNLGRLKEALAEMSRAQALDPAKSDISNDLGVVLLRLRRHEAALAWFDKALALKPDFKLAHNNRAYTLGVLRRFDEAHAVYAALKLADPNDPEPEWNAALLHLLTGNFEAGWREREARWNVPHLPIARYKFAQPRWLGQEPLAGKTILIYQDEGLGDVIQFARYLPMVAALGARVVLLVDAPLVSLLAKLPGVAECIPRSPNASANFDVHCPITSLPLAFGTRLETIPSHVPYLPSPDEARIRAWEQRLGPRLRLRVGLAWSGNLRHMDNENRSLPLSSLLPLLDLDATFVSLQKEMMDADRAMLRGRPDIIDLTALLTDFSETAALMSCLDLVITVDTSVAHFAGSLARPTWIILQHTPDWRWLLDCDDCAWYPTVRLFRQTVSGDFTSVVARVRSELVARIATSSPPPAMDCDPAPLSAAALIFNAAVAEMRAGRAAEARRCCEQALALDPHHAETLHVMGLLCLGEQQLDLAVEWISRAIRSDPRPPYLTSLGTALLGQGRPEEAVQVFDKSVQLRPDDAELWRHLGNALVEAGRRTEAILSLQQALKLNPCHFEAAHKTALLLYEAERYEEALSCFNLSAELEPGHFPTLYMRALTLQSLKRFEEALADNARAYALDPSSADACYNMGNLLRLLDRHQEAVGWYDKSLALRPNVAEALGNKAVVLAELRRFDEAMATYRQAIAAGDASAEWNLALLQLLLGDFEAGWAGQEARWKIASLSTGHYPELRQPRWLGAEPVGGKTVLVCAHEGLGDTIQFVRYVPMVAARGANVILVVQDALCGLLSGLEGVAQCLPISARPLPESDFHVPLSSLPLIFGTRLDTIPAKTSYLPRQATARVQAFDARLGARDGLRVGLVWSGNPNHKNDRNRSIPLSMLAPILDLDARFVSLQKEVRLEDAAALRARPEIIDLTADLADFGDAAALIANLDLVITVDTSVAHLSAALGCATWILLPHTPDFRWMLDRDDSPWYPTARLFRQSDGRDYASVIGRVRAELAAMCAVWPGELGAV